MPATRIQHEHLGVCACCGTETACTRGEVRGAAEGDARYLIKWTIGSPEHGMGWLIAFDDPETGRPVAVCLRYSFEENSFMVRHRGDDSWTAEDLAGLGTLLDRDEVIGTPLAPRVFAIVDDIWLTDPYLMEFVASARGGES